MKTIRAFIWGGAIGAVLGLLFAPQRGDVTRAQLQERFNQWQSQAQSRFGDLRESASGAIESGRKAVDNVRGQVQSISGKTDTTAAKLQDAADKAQNALNSTTTSPTV